MKNTEIFYVDGYECVKYGTTKKGVQRYRRKIDGKIVQGQYIKKPASDFEKYLAVFLYLKGMSLRKISEIVDYSHVAVYDWIMRLGEELKYKHQLSDIKEIVDLELDELFTFKDNKKKEFTL